MDMMSFDEQVSRNFNQDRLMARLAVIFGLLALALASIGLYGVLAHNVARRTQEIGFAWLSAPRVSAFCACYCAKR